MKKNELRKLRLLGMLSAEKRLDIGSVVKELQISEATARRLFAALEKDKKLIRVHGGVQWAPEAAPDYSFLLSAARQTEEKTAIGYEAARQVRSGNHIYLDSGTTVIQMAHALADRLRMGEIKKVTIVTNALSGMDVLAELAEVITVGGIFRPSRRDVCGPLAEKYLASYHFDKAFLGVDAISPAGELLTTDDRTAIMNETVLRNSAEVFILADSKKFEGKAFVAYAQLGDIAATIISDGGQKKKALAKLRTRNIRIKTVAVHEKPKL